MDDIKICLLCTAIDREIPERFLNWHERGLHLGFNGETFYLYAPCSGHDKFELHKRMLEYLR